MIKLSDINKNYNDNVVLSNINFNFNCGNIYVIKGPSGCGKTTLLNILSGIDTTYNGKYYFNNLDVSDNIDYLKSNIGYVFQNSLLISNLTIMDNLLLISTDIDKINYYADLFKVTDLFSKFPNQISGGERQRISIIRSLLLDNKVIICDEPTASLDRNTAEIIVNEIAKLRSKDRIIIISTHDDIFDNIANSIICLDYGRINNIKNKKIECNNEINYKGKNVVNDFKNIDKKYVKKRIKKNVRTKIIISLILLLILIFLGVKDNFKEEVLKMMDNQYPINTFHIYKNREEYMIFKNLNGLKIYENYFFNKDGIDYYSLPEKRDSIFKNDSILYLGRFPEKEEEILISYELAFETNNNIENLINNKITIDGSNYIVSGIISSDTKNINLINDSNHYYHLNQHDKAVFMLEDKIKSKINVFDTAFLLVSYDNLFNNKDVLKMIKQNNISLYWESVVDNYQYTIDLVFNILLIVVFFSSIIAFLFINNEILFKLEFRKKEIGYLQIFNVSKKRIKKILVSEYLHTVINSIIVSVVIYSVIVIGIFLIFNINIVPNLFKIIILLVLILIYVYLLISIPINKILKRDIINLIK